MDSNLATSQSYLAYKQRELAKEAKFQLHPESDLDSIEKNHLREIEELFNSCKSLKSEAENQIPVWDPIAQIQQKKIQLLIGERQLKSAEKQIQIIQAHYLSIMDPERSSGGIGRQSDIRNVEELKKQAQPLLSQATELIKKARHSVTFAELGARQRMGSFQKGQDHGPTNDSYEAREIAEEITPRPQTFPQIIQQEEWEPSQLSPTTPITPPLPPNSRLDQFSIPVKTITSSKDEEYKKSCCSKGWMIFFIVVILLLLIGAGIYVLTIYDVIKF